MSFLPSRVGRRLGALAASGALAVGALAVVGAPASAAPATTTSDSAPISGATFTWGLSNEQGGGAFAGGCNFLSAGTAGSTGSSRPWTEADGFYQTSAGNVTVEKPDAAGTYAQPTWATKCQDPNGLPVAAFNTASASLNRVKITGGSGWVADDGSATIQWTGSFTSVFYGGYTYWSAANPKLVVDAAGNGTLTATASGYGADMNDPSVWSPISARTITLANLKNVQVDADGFSVTPEYRNVEVDVPSGAAAQNRTAPTWGSFPQSFVTFQGLTGQSSYWYSSGGSRDAAKPATALSVGGYAVGAKPSVAVSETRIDPDGTAEVTVTGTNFVPSAATGGRPPFAGRPGGAYVAFGKVADQWRASKDAPSSNRGVLASNAALTKWAVPAAQATTVGAAYAELSPSGDFTATVTVDKATLDASVGSNTALTKYGIVTYPGSGALQAAYETFTPISFEDEPQPKDTTSIKTSAPWSWTYGQTPTLSFAVTSAGDGTPTGSVVAKLGSTKIGEGDVADGIATIQMIGTISAGKRQITLEYSGDDAHEPSTVVSNRTVNKAPVSWGKATLKTRPTSKKSGVMTVVMNQTGEGKAPWGNVTLTFTKGSVTKTVTKKINGTGDLTIPALSKGYWRTSATFAGDTNHVKTVNSALLPFNVLS